MWRGASLSQAHFSSRPQVFRPPVREAAKSFKAPKRVQENILARFERRLLDGFCRRLPAWVTPDHLTALGVIGAVITAAGYIASNVQPRFFFLASLGLIVNWFGDSLDGSLARYRKEERPRYGFFLDHSVDAISNLIVMVGLGFSPYVGMEVALFILVGYLLMTLYVFIFNQVSGEFRLSFLYCGPTELRLLAIWFNLMMYLLGPVPLSILGRAVSLHAVSVGVSGAVLVVLFTTNVYRTARDLAHQDGAVTARSGD
jgi:archaetidylinositol phosphate synthase